MMMLMTAMMLTMMEKVVTKMKRWLVKADGWYVASHHPKRKMMHVASGNVTSLRRSSIQMHLPLLLLFMIANPKGNLYMCSTPTTSLLKEHNDIIIIIIIQSSSSSYISHHHSSPTNRHIEQLHSASSQLVNLLTDLNRFI